MAEIMNDINKLRAECEIRNVSSWRLYEPSREAEREARKHKSVHPESCLCQGAGWLWGYEVGDYETDQKYQCREEQDDE